MKNEKSKNLEPDDRRLVRSDLNLEKWNIFSTRMKQGYREMRREIKLPDGGVQVQTVKVGLKGSTEALTTEEALIFYVILDLWRVQGEEPDGIVRTSVNYLLNQLIQSEKGEVKRGNWSKKWLGEKLSRLRRVGIEFSFYDRKNGEQETNVSFTLVSESVLYSRNKRDDRAKDRLSYIKIHPTILQNLKELYVKPVRIDVLICLKKEISRILYRFLDLILFDNPKYERDVKELAEELNIGAERIDNLLSQMRKSCEELEGKDLSSGRLDVCVIKRTDDGQSWKLVAKKGKQLVQVDPPVDIKHGDEFLRMEKIRREDEDREIRLMNFYQNLSAEEKIAIEQRKQDLIKENYGGFWSNTSDKLARLDSIEEKFNKRGPPNVSYEDSGKLL